MFILYTKINNEQKRTKKPKNGVQYEHIEHNVHSGHPECRNRSSTPNNRPVDKTMYRLDGHML